MVDTVGAFYYIEPVKTNHSIGNDKMKKQLLTLAAIVSLASGCASTTGVPCYAEVGVGTWVKVHDLAVQNDLIGETPTQVNLFCEKDNWTVGWYHTSDIGRGAPFNDQKEWVDEVFMVKYKVQVNNW